jgi:molybdate-binding protein/DNA-binding PadR family transcriptional regulator
MSPTCGLLGLLLLGARHGYDLKREIDREYAPFWRIDFGQLYRSLAKLTRAGWVRVRVEPGSGGPERKVYSVTPHGRAAFTTWLAEPAADRDEFVVKVRLATTVGLNVGPLVEAQRHVLQEEQAERLQAQRAAQEAGEAGRLVLAYAALHETEASRAALELCEAVVPTSRRYSSPVPPRDQLTITGSDDPVLARLAEFTHASARLVGSLGGLLALSRHEADVAGVHLLDAETGEYNIPFVKHLLPEDDLVLVNLAFRENGLMLAPGNPKKIRKLRDLARRDVRFINRRRGTGTRLLLYSKLRAARVDPHALEEWERAAATHEGVAAAIATGTADVGPGLRAVAETWGLEFIPLGEERYDLVLPRQVYESTRGRSMLEALHTAEFRRAAAMFAGYDLARTGRIIARIKA